MAPHLVLRQIVERKQQDNPRISLRWIAAKMGISSGRLSEIVNAKRPLTDYYAEKFCMALKLSEEEVESLYRALQAPSENTLSALLPEHVIEKMADWKPFALLTFFQTDTYLKIAAGSPTQDGQIKEIAGFMGLSEEELSVLLETMISLQLIQWNNEMWKLSSTESITRDCIPSSARPQCHIKDLSLAQEKVRDLSATKMDFSSMTLTMDAKDLPLAKRKIRDFRRSLLRSMEKSAKKDVYQISIQLFPVTADKET